MTTEDPERADEPPPIRWLLDQVAPLRSVPLVVRLGVPRLEQDLQLGLGIEVIVVLVDRVQRLERLLVPALGSKPSRGLGNEEGETGDEEGDDDIESDGESPREGVLVVFGALTDASTDDLSQDDLA